MRTKENDVTLFEYGLDQMSDPYSNDELLLCQGKR